MNAHIKSIEKKTNLRKYFIQYHLINCVKRK